MLLSPRAGSFARLRTGNAYALAAGDGTLGALRYEAAGGTVAVFALR